MSPVPEQRAPGAPPGPPLLLSSPEPHLPEPQKPHVESSDTKKLDGMYLSENNSVSGWKNQCFTPVMWLLLMVSKTPRGTRCVKYEQAAAFRLGGKTCVSAPKTALLLLPRVGESPDVPSGASFQSLSLPQICTGVFRVSPPSPSWKQESAREAQPEPKAERAARGELEAWLPRPQLCRSPGKRRSADSHRARISIFGASSALK